jgi:hypothetical protein
VLISNIRITLLVVGIRALILFIISSLKILHQYYYFDKFKYVAFLGHNKGKTFFEKDFTVLIIRSIAGLIGIIFTILAVSNLHLGMYLYISYRYLILTSISIYLYQHVYVTIYLSMM